MGSIRVEKTITVVNGSMSYYGITLGDVADWVARAMAAGAGRENLITLPGGEQVQQLIVTVPDTVVRVPVIKDES